MAKGKLIPRPYREAVLRRMIPSEKSVLVIQDTASLNYGKQRKYGKIGYISGKTLGVNIHTCLAVTTGGQSWVYYHSHRITTRKGVNRAAHTIVKKTRALEEKESYRWVSYLEDSTGEQPEGVHLVTEKNNRNL